MASRRESRGPRELPRDHGRVGPASAVLHRTFEAPEPTLLRLAQWTGCSCLDTRHEIPPAIPEGVSPPSTWPALAASGGARDANFPPPFPLLRRYAGMAGGSTGMAGGETKVPAASGAGTCGKVC